MPRSRLTSRPGRPRVHGSSRHARCGARTPRSCGHRSTAASTAPRAADRCHPAHGPPPQPDWRCTRPATPKGRLPSRHHRGDELAVLDGRVGPDRRGKPVAQQHPTKPAALHLGQVTHKAMQRQLRGRHSSMLAPGVIKALALEQQGGAVKLSQASSISRSLRRNGGSIRRGSCRSSTMRHRSLPAAMPQPCRLRSDCHRLPGPPHELALGPITSGPGGPLYDLTECSV
jgi:hypothetical protein